MDSLSLSPQKLILDQFSCHHKPPRRSSPMHFITIRVSLFSTLLPTLSDPALLGSYLPATPHPSPAHPGPVLFFIQPNLITSVREQGNDMCLHAMTEKLFLERTTLCAAHVNIPFPSSTLPAFQVEYITCTWLPRTRHTSSCQDWRERERRRAWQMEKALPSVLNK